MIFPQEKILRTQKAKNDIKSALKVTQLPQSSTYQKQPSELQLLQQQEWEVQEEIRRQSQRNKQQMHMMQMSWMRKLDDQQTRLESQLGRMDTSTAKQKSAQSKVRRHRKQTDPPPSWRPKTYTSSPVTESGLNSTDSLASEHHRGSAISSRSGREKATAERMLTMQHFKVPNVQQNVPETHESSGVGTPIPVDKPEVASRSTAMSVRQV